MQKQVAIYARVSSKKQKDNETIQSQVAGLIEYARKQSYNVPEGWIFTDEGVTGASLNRPALNALRELVHEEMLDAVLVYSPDRLSRAYPLQIVIEMEFEKKNVELIFLNTPKAKTPEEQFAVHFKGLFADYERAQIIERCRRGRLYRAKQGSAAVIPSAPLGYDYNKKSCTQDAFYTINDDAKTVRFIFNMYTHEHCTIAEVCRRLEEEGILTAKGHKNWSRSTVSDILRNQAYIGVAYFGKTEGCSGIVGRIYRKANGEKSCSPKYARKGSPEELWIPIKVPQIISESDFEIAQVNLRKNKQVASRNTHQPSILQGLLVCGYCKGSYYKKARSAKHVYYSCGKALKYGSCCGGSIKAPELDQAIWQHIVELLSNPQLVEEEIRRRVIENGDTKSNTLKLKDIEKNLIKLSRAKDKLLDAYQEGDCITLVGLKKRMKEINIKEKTLISEKNYLEKFLMTKEKQDSIKASLKEYQGLLAKADELSIKEKQNVLRLLVEEIVITDDDIEIRHCIPCQESDLKISLLCSDGWNGG